MSKSPKMTSLPKFYSIRTVADRLDLSARSVQRLIDSGTLPACKFGGAVRVSDDELQRFIARSQHAPAREG